MAKPSGLGRGLGDLLDDNNPSLRVQQNSSVVVRGSAQQTQAKPQKVNNLYASATPKPLFEPKPKNKSLK